MDHIDCTDRKARPRCEQRSYFKFSSAEDRGPSITVRLRIPAGVHDPSHKPITSLKQGRLLLYDVHSLHTVNLPPRILGLSSTSRQCLPSTPIFAWVTAHQKTSPVRFELLGSFGIGCWGHLSTSKLHSFLCSTIQYINLGRRVAFAEPLLFQGGGVRLKAGIDQSWLCLSPLLDHAFLLSPVIQFAVSGAVKTDLTSASERQSRRRDYTPVQPDKYPRFALQFRSHVRLPSSHSASYQDYTMEIPYRVCDISAGPSRRQHRSTHSASYRRTSHTSDVTPPARDPSRQASLRLDFIIVGGGESRSHVPDTIMSYNQSIFRNRRTFCCIRARCVGSSSSII